MFAPRELFPFVDVLEENWEVIRDEAFGLPVEKYPAWWAKQNYVGMWRLAPIIDKGDGPVATDETGRILDTKPHCPRTSALLLDIDGLTSAGYSVLEPGSSIIPHKDEYDEGQFFRLHLGLHVPEGCEMRVGEERRRHADGEAFVFNTSIEHEACNPSDRHRLILILDVRAAAYPAAPPVPDA